MDKRKPPLLALQIPTDNPIDTPKSPHKAIVSVLMLKEGRDVHNVTTIAEDLRRAEFDGIYQVYK
jgi:hypothetical protein